MRILVLSLTLGFASAAHAQLYESGSTGVDGALAPADDAGIVEVVLPPDGVLNYTLVDIPPDVTIRFVRNPQNTGVFILSQGDINVDGTIDVSGADGTNQNTGDSSFCVSLLGGTGGPGASDGGSFGCAGASSGIGPGGGGSVNQQANQVGGAGASFVQPGFDGKSNSKTDAGVPGQPYGDPGLTPLHGGSGGGAVLNVGADMRSGAGGGGLVVLASSGSITINGQIHARGGSPAAARFTDAFGNNGRVAGAGGGGVIRLAAAEVGGDGLLDVRGGTECTQSASGNAGPCGGDGLIRVESFNVTGTLLDNSLPEAPLVLTPENAVPYSPELRPQLRISKVAGKSPAQPTQLTGHALRTPGVAVPEDSTIVVEVVANNVPTGTTVVVAVNALGDERQTFPTTPLAGTFDSSVATVEVPIPAGVKIGTIEAHIPSLPVVTD